MKRNQDERNGAALANGPLKTDPSEMPAARSEEPNSDANGPRRAEPAPSATTGSARSRLGRYRGWFARIVAAAAAMLVLTEWGVNGLASAPELTSLSRLESGLDPAMVLAVVVLAAAHGLVVVGAQSAGAATVNRAETSARRGMLISGVGAVAFLAAHGWHVYNAWRWSPMYSRAALDAELAGVLSSTYHGAPVWAVLYLLGLAALAHHIAAGLLISQRARLRGLRRQSRQGAHLLVIGAAIGMWLLGARRVVLLATGGEPWAAF